MPTTLVIVESPTKAKTITRFLGSGFQVVSSNGHIRDLPAGKFGIDIEKGFAPTYVVSKDSQKTVTDIKKRAARATAVYFATDEDREGEAISWHLAELLSLPPDRVKRITFHEITKDAITRAIAEPRGLNLHLVNAQQARRILDRIVGYKLSPFLWKKVAKGLSAGRVQSVALRLVVEREREIQAFKTREYWAIEGNFKTKDATPLPARLAKIGETTLGKFDIATEAAAKEIEAALANASYTVAGVESRDAKKSPLAPLTTSTLQQEANRRFNFSTRQTMFYAQQLYEGITLGADGSVGLISYMRTDSVALAREFVTHLTQFVGDTWGKRYQLPTPRTFTKKQKLAQEAHEAIRPTDVARTPESVKTYLEPALFKLYDFIWRRTVATQMADAVVAGAAIDIDTSTGHRFRATGQTITFDGFLAVYPTQSKDTVLPAVTTGDTLALEALTLSQKFTQPPARYSEAGLVKALEEHGIGRPSTYAPTIATIRERNYVVKNEGRLAPTDIGIVVNDVLVKHFTAIVDYQFTAHMEDDLDKIAQGTAELEPVLKEFYEPFQANLATKEKEVGKKELTETATDEVCEKCGRPMVVKIGRFGKFLACTGYPACRNTKPLPGDERKRAAAQATDEKCPECGSPVVIRQGRYGPFFGCSTYPKCKYIKNIEQGTGVTCPSCGKGELVEKRSRKTRRTFYSCNRYPACTFSVWSKPTGGKCAECGSLEVAGKHDTVVCSNKECMRNKARKTAS